MFRPVVALVASLAAPALSAPLDLAPKFEPGVSSRYRYVSQTEQAFFVAQEQKGFGASSSDTRATITVESATDDGAVLSVVFESALIEFKGAGLDILFDSSAPPEQDPDSPIAPAFRSFLGKPVRCVVNAKGALVRVEGATELVPAQDPARKLALHYLSDANLRWLIDTAFVAKPAPASASVGDKWTVTRSEPHEMGTLQTELNYTLDSDDAGMASMSIQGTDSVQKLVGVGARKGSESVEHLPARIAGGLRWDTNRGRADRFELMTQSMDVEQHAQMGEIRKQVVQVITVERVN